MLISHPPLCPASAWQVDDTTFKARVDSMRAQLQGPHPPNVEKMDVVATSLENTGLLGPNAAPLPSSTAEGCKGGLLTAEGVAQHRSLGSFFRRVSVSMPAARFESCVVYLTVSPWRAQIR